MSFYMNFLKVNIYFFRQCKEGPFVLCEIYSLRCITLQSYDGGPFCATSYSFTGRRVYIIFIHYKVMKQLTEILSADDTFI